MMIILLNKTFQYHNFFFATDFISIQRFHKNQPGDANFRGWSTKTSRPCRTLCACSLTATAFTVLFSVKMSAVNKAS